jgi:hypothetical protein
MYNSQPVSLNRLINLLDVCPEAGLSSSSHTRSIAGCCTVIPVAIHDIQPRDCVPSCRVISPRMLSHFYPGHPSLNDFLHRTHSTNVPKTLPRTKLISPTNVCGLTPSKGWLSFRSSQAIRYAFFYDDPSQGLTRPNHM